ncbi:hypothetical protein T492DRAFT_901344 [Pavlovales sp. CCMP2436]|nr:hypothetical protein T492DRAFT_901344 [Pavlovales sp. CCMP2436]
MGEPWSPPKVTAFARAWDPATHVARKAELQEAESARPRPAAKPKEQRALTQALANQFWACAAAAAAGGSRPGSGERGSLGGFSTGGKMYALMGVSPMEAAARIKKQLIDTIGTIAARGHAQLLLARLSALDPIAAQRGNTTNSNQQIISLNALARAHYRRSIGTCGGAQASAAD